jgi:hypothetical protein
LLLNVSWWSCEDEKSIVSEGKILESSIAQEVLESFVKKNLERGDVDTKIFSSHLMKM